MTGRPAATAWQTFRRMNRRNKALVIVTAPLWLPIAFVAWLDHEAVQ